LEEGFSAGKKVGSEEGPTRILGKLLVIGFRLKGEKLPYLRKAAFGRREKTSLKKKLTESG